VLDYLKRQNRPYSASMVSLLILMRGELGWILILSCSFSANFFFFFYLDDVFNNLHGKVGKTNLVKVLTSLCNSGDIVQKTYAKSQIYVAKQVIHRLEFVPLRSLPDAFHLAFRSRLIFLLLMRWNRWKLSRRSSNKSCRRWSKSQSRSEPVPFFTSLPALGCGQPLISISLHHSRAG